MQDVTLIEITRVVDDSTGMYDVGDLDFTIHSGALYAYIKDSQEKRDLVVKHMRWLADQLEKGESPFAP